MDRLDLWLLSVLYFHGTDSYLVAMSINEILQEDHDTTRISVYKHLKRLVRKHYVATGPKDNKAESYYITERGKEALISLGKVE